MEHNFIENELVILTKQTLDIFLKQENPSELIALYTFYYYTAKWQHTNQIKCTTDYVAKGLHWNKHKVIRVKKQLLAFGLIEDARIVDETTKKVTGYYIKMNYIFKKTTLDKSQCAQNPHTGSEALENPKTSVSKSDTLENEHTNALSTVNLNALSAVNLEREIKKRENAKRFSPPTVQEVKEYCLERGNNIDAEKFVAFYQSKGWKVGNNNMKDWKSAIITWEKRDDPPTYYPHKSNTSCTEQTASYNIEEYENNYNIMDYFDF